VSKYILRSKDFKVKYSRGNYSYLLNSDVPYVLISDTAVRSDASESFMDAVNTLAMKGWRMISYTTVRDIERFGKLGGLIFQAIMENPKFRRQGGLGA